jgi:hypothetical protein
MAKTPARRDERRLRNERLVLVVYAPFGSDETLSTYPNGSSQQLAQHPLVRSLLGVARSGVSVCALVDRVGCDTMLVEIPGGKAARATVTSCWKQDMASPRTLAGLLGRAQACHPKHTLVLALEGHGAGYLPEIDRRQITHQTLTTGANGSIRWEINPAPAVAPGEPTPDMGSPILPMGGPIQPGSSNSAQPVMGGPIQPGSADSAIQPVMGGPIQPSAADAGLADTTSGDPVLPMGGPIQPGASPLLPANHWPLSTWGLAEALRLSREEKGASRVAVVHLNNCFNLSTELLHTLMPHADVATGYGNYNFFTAGTTYPGLFQALRGKTYSAEDLARAFALGNRDLLQAKRNHPTVGGMVRLERMAGIAQRVDTLAGELTDALRAAGAGRATLTQRIREAIVRAQTYDTDGSFRLEVPDQLVDLMSLAAHLQAPDLALSAPIKAAAHELHRALVKVKQYGANDRPWLVEPPPAVRWDFRSRDLAMNILLPDPDRRGLYDWRSIYYLNKHAETDTPLVQPHVIDFLKQTRWVDFIIEYHRDVPLKGLLPARIPDFPVFNAEYKPRRDNNKR